MAWIPAKISPKFVAFAAGVATMLAMEGPGRESHPFKSVPLQLPTREPFSPRTVAGYHQ